MCIRDRARGCDQNVPKVGGARTKRCQEEGWRRTGGPANPGDAAARRFAAARPRTEFWPQPLAAESEGAAGGAGDATLEVAGADDHVEAGGCQVAFEHPQGDIVEGHDVGPPLARPET